MYLTWRLYTLVNAIGWLARVVEVVVPPGYNRTFHHYDLEYWRRGECLFPWALHVVRSR